MPDTKLGTQENPHLVAPEDFLENGVEYGAWFRCSVCKGEHHSTFHFDCHAEKGGDPLVCTYCAFRKGEAQRAPA